MSNTKIVGINVELFNNGAWQPFMQFDTTQQGVVHTLQHATRKEQQALEAGHEPMTTRMTFNATAFGNEPAIIDMHELSAELDASW